MLPSPTNPRAWPDPHGRAQRAIDFVESFDLWEGDKAGQPIKLEPYQRSIIRAIYGPSDARGRRLVKEAAIWLPRGNAKTTLMAALGILHLVEPEFSDAGPQVLLAAADREQAGIAYKSMEGFLDSYPELQRQLKVLPSVHRIKYAENRGEIRVLSHESKTKQGLSGTFVLCDEIHAWPEREGYEMFNTLRNSQVKRSSPLLVSISTAGKGSGGIAFDKWQQSDAVQSGQIKDPTFAVFFAGAEESDRKKWRQKNVWRKASPGLRAGIVNIEQLEKLALEGRTNPVTEADFMRYHLNLWQAGVSVPWVRMELYDKCEARRPIEKGALCAIGVDIARLHDLLSVVAVFPDSDGGFDVLAKHFTTRRKLERHGDKDLASYRAWLNDGIVALAGEDIMQDEPVLDYIQGLCEEYEVATVLCDPYQAMGIVNALLVEGIDARTQQQGKKLAAGMSDLQDAIRDGRWRHGGDPCLRMCFGNAVVTGEDWAGNPTVAKGKAEGRVDGVFASLMAVQYWGTEEGAERKRGLGTMWDDGDTPMLDALSAVE